MVQELDAVRGEKRAQRQSESNIFLRGNGQTANVVMRKNDGSSPMEQRCFKNLLHIQSDPIKTSFRQQIAVKRLPLCVQTEQIYRFVPHAEKIGSRYSPASDGDAIAEASSERDSL